MWPHWALAQNTHRAHFGPWLPPWHSWRALPETSWLRFRTVGCYNLQCFYYTYNVFSIYRNSDLIMEIRIFVFSYHHSSPCMNQITVNLHCIELECLLLKIAIWVSYFKIKKNKQKPNQLNKQTKSHIYPCSEFLLAGWILSTSLLNTHVSGVLLTDDFKIKILSWGIYQRRLLGHIFKPIESLYQLAGN